MAINIVDSGLDELRNHVYRVVDTISCHTIGNIIQPLGSLHYELLNAKGEFIESVNLPDLTMMKIITVYGEHCEPAKASHYPMGGRL